MRKAVCLAAMCAALALSSGRATAGDAPRAIDVVENDLVADDSAVRAKAALELVDRFPDGAVAVPMLVDLLDDESQDVVAATARAIDSMAVAGAAKLTAWCADDARLGPKTRIGEALPVLFTLREPSALDPIDMKEAADGKSPPDVPVMSALILDRRRNRPPLASLHFVLRASAPPTRDAALAAMAVCADDVVAARGIGPASNPARVAAATAAIALLRSDWDMRSWIGARLLARLRPTDATTIAALVETTTATKKPTMSQAHHAMHVAPAEAARTLGAIGPSAASAAPMLLDALAKPSADPEARTDVPGLVHALLSMGKESDVVALLGRKPPTADEIASALAAEGRAAKTVVPLLMAALEQDEVRVDVARGLSAFGPAAAAAVPLFRKCAKSIDDRRFAIAFADAVLAVSPTDAEAAKFVESVLTTSKDDGERAMATTTLAERAAPSAALAARLRTAIGPAAADKTDAFYELSWLDGLARCGADAKAAVPELVQLLAVEQKNRGDWRSRSIPENRPAHVVRTLGRIGPDAAAAVPALTALRDKGDETIRVPAAQALRRIRAKK